MEKEANVWILKNFFDKIIIWKKDKERERPKKKFY